MNENVQHCEGDDPFASLPMSSSSSPPFASVALAFAHTYREEYEMDAPGEGEESNEETFIEIVSRDQSLRGEKV